MICAGIKDKIFGAHSVRSAVTSKAKMKAVPVQDIMKKAGWTRQQTFAKFYDKKVVTEDTFTSAVLKIYGLIIRFVHMCL
ncbi:MAG: hypothetical protein ABW185_26175 [Sedimenticola sp.]